MVVLKHCKIFALFALTLNIPLFGQVPVFVEPKAYQFENYANKSLAKTSEVPGLNLTLPVDLPSYYSPSVNPQVYNPSMWMIEKYYVRPGMSPQEQVRYADEQIRLHELEKKQNQTRITEANTILNEMHIEYDLPFDDLPEKRIYGLAFSEIEKMLNGQSPLDLVKAVFLVEHAYDPSISFAEFDGQLNKSAAVIGLKMQQDNIAPMDNLGKVMTAFKFMADTITVRTKQETTITTYPKTYDFEDFWGRQNYKKMFVSKLLKDGSGQCHSMPLLFLLLCEKIGAEANLSFAPNHSFVKFKDKRGKWHNLELTNGMLASDHFMIESGYIKAEAIQNKIYLEPLTKKQVIIQCLNDLAMGYQQKYGYDPFVKESAVTALHYDSLSLTARQILANCFMTTTNYIVHQYKQKGLTKEHFDNDASAQRVVELAHQANAYIEKLGYSDMPVEVYESWLRSIKKESSKQQHLNEVKVLGGMIERK